jgi:hypothetical protein
VLWPGFRSRIPPTRAYDVRIRELASTHTTAMFAAHVSLSSSGGSIIELELVAYLQICVHPSRRDMLDSAT